MRIDVAETDNDIVLFGLSDFEESEIFAIGRILGRFSRRLFRSYSLSANPGYRVLETLRWDTGYEPEAVARAILKVEKEAMELGLLRPVTELKIRVS